MASSSPYPLRYSRRSSLSSARNAEDSELNSRRQSKNSNDFSIRGVTNGGVVRRRSTSNGLRLKILEAQTTTVKPERTRNNHKQDSITMNNENDIHDQEANDLNLSFTSTATDNLQISTQIISTDDSDPANADNKQKKINYKKI